MKSNKNQNLFEYLSLIILLGLFAYFLFYHLGRHYFIDWDEAIYAQVAKEIVVNHQWLSLTYFGNAWFEKPPLMLWLTAFGFKIFGINELGGRFFVALLAEGTIALTYFFTKKISGSKLAAFLATSSYLICFHFWHDAYFLQLNTAVCFFILLAMFSYLKFDEGKKYFYLFFISLALGVLTKGVVGLLPLPIIVIHGFIFSNFKFLKNPHFYSALFTGLTIVLPWHIYMSVKFGKEFWDIYLLLHTLQRFSSQLENNGGPLGYYITLISQNDVFKILILGSLIYFLFKIKVKNYAFILISTLFIFSFFSLAKTKGYGYMTVIYPYAMAMIGIALKEFLSFSKSKILITLSVSVILIVFVFSAQGQNKYKLFKWENEQVFIDNKEIADFLHSNYENTPIYVSSWQYGATALNYYLGRPTASLPKNIIVPTDYSKLTKARVFHRANRSIYLINNVIYIAQ